MTDLAVKYFEDGYNCSQCILKAFEEKYNFTVDKQCYEMCEPVSGGFGVGCMCGALLAGVMVFGLLFDKETVKRLRLGMLIEINLRYGSINCATLRDNQECTDLVRGIADVVDQLIHLEISNNPIASR